jgi:YesN/AraC family two-component response regulator
LDDPLRNLKNYSIIMNTLLRKAAENGGVHPFYLDDVSSSFAARIEQVPTVRAAQELMSEMFRTYCRLVRQRSMKQYSAAVQKALAMIDADLSADLSLSKLAQAQNISAGYLSAIFKKETGSTVTDHINRERMQLAAHLLQTTALQVQTVAAHCGMLDVQYFSKVFKKYMKKTPKAYRESFQ